MPLLLFVGPNPSLLADADPAAVKAAGAVGGAVANRLIDWLDWIARFWVRSSSDVLHDMPAVWLVRVGVGSLVNEEVEAPAVAGGR